MADNEKTPPPTPPPEDDAPPGLAGLAEDLTESLQALSAVNAAALPALLSRIDAIRARVDSLERRFRAQGTPEEPTGS